MDSGLIMSLMGVGALVLVALIVFDKGSETKALGKRIKRVKGVDEKELLAQKVEKLSLKREVKDSGIPLVDRLIKSVLPNPQRLRDRLARTGKNITVSEYLLITAVAIAVAFLAFKMLFGMKLLVAVLLAGTVGIMGPHIYIGGMGKSRAKKFIKFFPESIDAMVRSIKSGLPIAEAINVVAAEMPDPVGTEFARIRDNVRMGRSLEAAMWDVARRLDIPEYRYLIIALSIQRETGGNLAETLQNVAEVLRKRRQIKLKIKAMSSEAKSSAMILGALPFIVILALSVFSGDYITPLFSDPRGNILCCIAAGMMGTGIFIMSQMINFEI